MFIVFSFLRDEKIINVTSSRRYFFFTRAKFDANNGLFNFFHLGESWRLKRKKAKNILIG